MTTRTRPRSGFTLIELLVVIGIVVFIAGLAVLFLPNLDKNKGVPNAATQFHGWVNLAKQQALRDKAPRGIRLVQDVNDPTRVTSIQYIEQPEPVAPRGPFIRLDVRTMICYDPVLYPNPAPPAPTPPFSGPLTVVTLFQADYTQVPPGQYPPENFWINWDGVSPGDYLELTGGPQGLGLIRRYTYPAQPSAPGIPPAPTGAGTAKFSQFIIDRVIDGTELDPNTLMGQGFDMTSGFRVIRAPRPLVGEPMLQLHKDVYIDLTWCYPCPINLGPVIAPPNPFPYGNNYTGPLAWSPNNIDILFNSTGIVANAPVGRLVVAIRHIDRPNDMLFVTIFTRTGKVGVFTVNDSGSDPYSFTQDGTNSGL